MTGVGVFKTTRLRPKTIDAVIDILTKPQESAIDLELNILCSCGAAVL